MGCFFPEDRRNGGFGPTATGVRSERYEATAAPMPHRLLWCPRALLFRMPKLEEKTMLRQALEGLEKKNKMTGKVNGTRYATQQQRRAQKAKEEKDSPEQPRAVQCLSGPTTTVKPAVAPRKQRYCNRR
ncbi:hypothetical protein MRX96_042288 [Rhipicephalus microplus]